MTYETTGDGSQLEALIRRGTTAARAGDRDEARKAFREATRLDPSSVAAWLGLGGVVGTMTEKKQCFQRALELDPDNREAREALDLVERRLSGRVDEPRESFSPAPGSAMPPAAAQTADMGAAVAQEETEFCFRHPERETSLHCIQCGRAICGQCATMSPVGQLCPICRKERRMPNYKVAPIDAVKGFIAGAIAGGIGGFLSSIIGFFFMFFLGALIGEGVMRVIEYATNKRGPLMQAAAGLGILSGVAAYYFYQVSRIRAQFPPEMLEQFEAVGQSIPGPNILPLVIFLVLAIGTTTARLR